MATAFDDFSGATVGSTPTGWTLRKRDADTWAIDAETDGAATGGKVARLDHGSDDDNLAYITHDTVGSVSGACEIVTRWRINTGETVARTTALALLYANTAASAGYAAEWRQTEFRIVHWSGGIENAFVGSAYTGFTPVANTWYYTRLSVDASGNFSAWFNADGSTGTAHITGTDTSITSGYVGIGGSSYESMCDFDIVGIGTGGDAAPITGGGGATAAVNQHRMLLGVG